MDDPDGDQGQGSRKRVGDALPPGVYDAPLTRELAARIAWFDVRCIADHPGIRQGRARIETVSREGPEFVSPEGERAARAVPQPIRNAASRFM